MNRSQRCRIRKNNVELMLEGTTFPMANSVNPTPNPWILSKPSPKKNKMNVTKSVKLKPISTCKSSADLKPEVNASTNWVSQNLSDSMKTSQIRPLKYNNSIPTVGIGLTKTGRFTPRTLEELHRDVHTTELAFENPAAPSRPNFHGSRLQYKSSSNSIPPSWFKKAQGDDYKTLGQPQQTQVHISPRPHQRYITDKLKAEIIAAVKEEILMEQKIQKQIEVEEERRYQKELMKRNQLPEIGIDFMQKNNNMTRSPANINRKGSTKTKVKKSKSGKSKKK